MNDNKNSSNDDKGKNSSFDGTSSQSPHRISPPICLDLFCGCGGLSKGFEMAGYHVAAGIDNWNDALQTYRLNHKASQGILADMTDCAPSEIAGKYGLTKVDVICGGPPCQGFSIAGKRIVDDIRNTLYKSFVRFVKFFNPPAFVMENVPNILSIGNGTVRDSILEDFGALGYSVEYKILNAADYGVPQARRRTFFVGLKGESFSFPKPTAIKYVTTKEALSDLPEESLPENAPYPCPPKNDYQKMIRKGSIGVTNHSATIHTEQTKRIIAMVPDGCDYRVLPLELQQTRKVHIAWTRFCSSKPSYTIDCGHNHHFHYQYNRVPTVRESARLQSFPDSYHFTCGKTSQLKQVGNAVPPYLSYAVASALKEYLK